MTTDKIMIVGLMVALVPVTDLLANKTSLTKPAEPTASSTLIAKQPGEALESKPLPKPDTVAREVKPLKPEGAIPTNTAVSSEKVILKIDLPKFFPGGTPGDIRSANLEPPLGEKGRDPIKVPTGTIIISKGCKVTSSDPEPIIGELGFVTDGDKEHAAETYVELSPGLQWVQIDLGKEKQLFGACLWHFHGDARVYRDVVCQVSNDPDFIDGVQTVFNNDHDNSSKLGPGRDKEYIETFHGRPFAIPGVKGRYVRLYSQGNTSNGMNHYTEFEIYGKDL